MTVTQDEMIASQPGTLLPVDGSPQPKRHTADHDDMSDDDEDDCAYDDDETSAVVPGRARY